MSAEIFEKKASNFSYPKNEKMSEMKLFFFCNWHVPFRRCLKLKKFDFVLFTAALEHNNITILSAASVF